MQVVGCDVARGRWVAVVLVDGAFDHALLVGSLADVVEVPAAAIAVDIPIGLPATGWRTADLEARAFVGPRRNSVFMTPIRAAVLEPDHAKASALSVADHGKGISRQAHGLRHMILDAERVAAQVHEAHPECSFRAMNGDVLRDPKTTWNGMHTRLALLARHGIALPAHVPGGGDVRPDDLIDAAAVAWTATRIAAGTSFCLGGAIHV